MEEDLHNELIDFMFLRDADGQLDVMKCLGLWFGKSNETDIEIETRFGSHVAMAIEGGYSDWEKTPRGCLALMILVDQFPRNIYRHTVRMYDGDRTGRTIVDAGHNWLEVLKPEECLFVPCLIMTHQENLADQQYCLEFYDLLEPRIQSEFRVFRTIFEEHLRIISLCGSFPHRDHYYARTTSDVGRMLMDNPKLRFDLPLIADNGTVRFGHDPRKLWQAAQLAFDVLERIDALADETARRRSTIAPGGLSPKEIAEYHEVFRKFDKDGSGFFDRDELTAVLASTGRSYNPAQIQKAMDRITGVDGSTGITFEQFADLLRVKMSSDWETRVRQRFTLFDVDGSGQVSLEELRECIQGLDDLVTSAEIEEMMSKCDVDGDGLLSYEDFLTMVPILVERRASQVAEAPILIERHARRVVEAPPVFALSVWGGKPESVHISEVEVLDPLVS